MPRTSYEGPGKDVDVTLSILVPPETHYLNLYKDDRKQLLSTLNILQK